MIKLARNCIERIYGEKDYDYFRNQSKKIPLYYDSLLKLATSECKKFYIMTDIYDPSIEILFKLGSYDNHTFHIEYESKLKISKIADLFVFQHEFCIEDIDPNRIVSDLDGFGGQPYTLSQSNLEKKFTTFLKNYNLTKVNLSDMDECVNSFELPEKTIFGNYMTLDNALFRDLLGICENN